MSKIRSTNTTPELAVRKFLFKEGFRYRLHQKELPSRPDIVLKKYKTVILVNGCFWHKHKKCKYATVPSSNVDYWKNKLDKNVKNDKIAIRQLQDLGWRVIIIWECQMKNKESASTLVGLLNKLREPN